MANNLLLNNVAHQDLKVAPGYSAEFGDNLGSVLAFPTEFVELQKEYPILFRKDPETDRYKATVLLGLNQNENLFLNPGARSGWAANYVPAVVAKGPFLIGVPPKDSPSSEGPFIYIDMDHAKVGHKDGVALFLEQGGKSAYLKRIANVLEIIHNGMAVQDAMFDVFSEMDLIEPLSIEIDLHNGKKHKLVGNYTINHNKLAELSGDKLERLSRLGFLPLAYAVVTSLTNIQALTELKKNKNEP